MLRLILVAIAAFAEFYWNCILIIEDFSQTLIFNTKNRNLKRFLVALIEPFEIIGMLISLPILSIGWHADNLLYELYDQYAVWEDGETYEFSYNFRQIDQEIDWDWKKEGF